MGSGGREGPGGPGRDLEEVGVGAGLRNALPFPSSGFGAQPTKVKFTKSHDTRSLSSGRSKRATCSPLPVPARDPN